MEKVTIDETVDEINRWWFICDGDPQVGYDFYPDGSPKIRKEKEQIARRVSNISNKTHIDFVICSGDLTDHGWGNGGGACCMPIKRPDQLAEFINSYEKPLENAGFPVKLCLGNHDTYVDWPYFYKGVFNYVEKKHGATNYIKNIYKSGLYYFDHKGFRFICMGIKPYRLSWLKSKLPENKTTPVVIFYHFNTIPTEPFSDWWTEKEKDAFYETIKYHNVVLIANGHLHASGHGNWHGIPVVRGSGEELAVISVAGDKITSITYDTGI